MHHYPQAFIKYGTTEFFLKLYLAKHIKGISFGGRIMKKKKLNICLGTDIF